MPVGPFLRTLQADKQARYTTMLPIAATQYFRDDGGRFVTLTSGYYELSTAADTQIDGWVDICYDINSSSNPTCSTPFTSSSTAGASVLSGTKDIFNADCGFWIPVKTSLTIATTNLDQLYDIAIEGSTTTTKQVLDIGATSQKVLKVIDIDIINNLAKVIAVQQE